MLLDIGRLHSGILIIDMVGIRFGYVVWAEEKRFVVMLVLLKESREDVIL